MSRDPLESYLRGEIEYGSMPGAAWWVGSTAGVVSRGAAGWATLEPVREPLREGTPFDLASLTKPLATAILAVMAERDGLIRLDQELGSVFPELRESPFSRTTLDDAARHRAGLPSWVPLYLQGRTPAAYLRAIATLDRAAAPGETLYSDLGYILLGFALERSSGSGLDRLFASRVAEPLGLARCGFPPRTAAFADAAATERGNAYERRLAGGAAGTEIDGAFRAHVPRGEVHDGNAWGLGGVAGHAGLFASAPDVAAIALALLDPTRLGLTAAACDAMFTAAEGPGARTVGFEPARGTESVRGVLPDAAVGHFGFTGTSVWIDRARPRVYVLLTNRVHPTVPAADFVAVRRGFHALASAL